jgi:hypothetical protein
MRRSRIGVSRNIIIWVSLSFRVERNLKGCELSQSLRSPSIFGIEVGVEIYLIGMSIDTKRIGRSILVQCSQVNQASSCQLERKLVMETIETIQCRIIYSKSSPKPANNTCSNNWLGTSQTSNNCSPPQRHLSPGQNITNKCCLNHYQQNNYSY